MVEREVVKNAVMRRRSDNLNHTSENRLKKKSKIATNVGTKKIYHLDAISLVKKTSQGSHGETRKS